MWTLLEVVAAVAVALLALVWVFQRRLIYLPMGPAIPAASDVLPGAEEVSFGTDDGLTLRGWFVPAEGPGAAATLAVFNGNAGNRALRAPLAEALRRRGLSVLLFDYRGYGGNPGDPSEEGLLGDARAARAYLESRGDVDPRRIAFFGESLGAAVAVAAAAERAPAALVLRSPFTSLGDVGRIHYPFLPVRLLLWDRYPSLDRIRGVRCPLLVIAGERDWIVPAPQSRALFEAAPEGTKRFVLFPGADHNDEEFLSGDRMSDEVAGFLRRVMPTPSAGRRVGQGRKRA